MLAFIYGLGLQEVAIVVGLGLLLFGGKRLPGVGRGIGQGLHKEICVKVYKA